MAAAEDLFDALGRLDAELSTADERALAAGLTELARFRTACDALWLSLVAEAARRGTHRRHGARDAATWIAEMAGERRGAARREVELAGRVSAMPQVAEAMASGQLSAGKAAELVRAAELPEEVQSALLEDAVGAPVEQVAASVERARLAYGAGTVPPTPELTISRCSGQAKVEGTLDLVDAEIVDVALTTMIEALKLPTEMPYSERRARALVGLARHYLDNQTSVTGRVGRPHVLVVVDLEVLEARSGGSATLASGAVITGDQVRRLAEDAGISRVITQGRSEPLDVGRTTRSIPPAIAKAVIARDRHCRYRGCTSPPWACDVHHRQPWECFGPTSLANTGLLCWFHHEHVHRHGPERVIEVGDGRWVLDFEHDAAAVAA
jgi:hypothetical protein